MNRTVEDFERMSPELNYEDDYQGLLEQATEGDVDAAHKIAELSIEHDEPYLRSLVNQLKEGIQEGRWSAIIGDDRDGRIPALIIGRLMKRAAHELDTPPPKQLFMAGGRDVEPFNERDEALGEHFNKMIDQLGQRPLLLTQYIESSNTIYSLGLKIMQAKYLPFDVAAVTADTGAEYYLEQLGAPNGLAPGCQVYIGGWIDDAYQHSAFTGETHFTGLKDKVGAFATPERDPKLRPVINSIREVAYSFADRLYKEEFNGEG